MLFPANQIVHMPSGEVPACDTHANQLRGMAGFLGFHAATTEAPKDAACINCINEDKAANG